VVINKDPVNSQGANIALTGFTPAATATVYSYGIPQDNAAKPAATGSPDLASSSMSVSGATFSASFAPYSATVIALAVGSTPAPTPTPTPTPTPAPASSGGGGGAPSSWFLGALVLLGIAGRIRRRWIL
jgi:MYXO-CTERM domain-containing protein